MSDFSKRVNTRTHILAKQHLNMGVLQVSGKQEIFTNSFKHAEIIKLIKGSEHFQNKRYCITEVEMRLEHSIVILKNPI